MTPEQRAEQLVKLGPIGTSAIQPPDGVYWVYLGDCAICDLSCTEEEALAIASPYRKVIAAAIREAAKAEQEACAALAEELGAFYIIEEPNPTGPGLLCENKSFADAIRAMEDS